MARTLHRISLVVVAAGGVAASLMISSAAFADPYKWCATYRTGGQNCGFLTIEQCQATVSGVGGFCQQNQFYTGPDKSSSRASTRVSRAKPAEKPAAQTRRAPEDRSNQDRFQ